MLFQELLYGVAFRIHPDKSALVRENLVQRETGYDIVSTMFYPSNPKMEPFELELFMATDKDPTYLGPASAQEIAWQIYHAKVSL